MSLPQLLLCVCIYCMMHIPPPTSSFAASPTSSSFSWHPAHFLGPGGFPSTFSLILMLLLPPPPLTVPSSAPKVPRKEPSRGTKTVFWRRFEPTGGLFTRPVNTRAGICRSFKEPARGRSLLFLAAASAGPPSSSSAPRSGPPPRPDIRGHRSRHCQRMCGSGDKCAFQFAIWRFK